MERSGRSLSAFFLTALFRAAGLAVITLPLLPHVGVTAIAPDPVLLGALVGLTLGAALFTWHELLDKPRETFTRADMLGVVASQNIERFTFHYTALDGHLKEMRLPSGVYWGSPTEIAGPVHLDAVAPDLET